MNSFDLFSQIEDFLEIPQELIFEELSEEWYKA